MNAKFWLEHGGKFPYDATDEWSDKYPADPPPMPSDWAHSAARGILANLTDRRGVFPSEVDEKTRIEIVATLAEIIRAAEEPQ